MGTGRKGEEEEEGEVEGDGWEHGGGAAQRRNIEGGGDVYMYGRMSDWDSLRGHRDGLA